jgi:energy-coupling factor transporter ATP-binding protein EcfA2
MALFQELNDQGITILIVTHEPDVAQYAKRIVDVRDGRIVRDHPVANRRRAADDLRALDEAGGGRWEVGEADADVSLSPPTSNLITHPEAA